MDGYTSGNNASGLYGLSPDRMAYFITNGAFLGKGIDLYDRVNVNYGSGNYPLNAPPDGLVQDINGEAVTGEDLFTKVIDRLHLDFHRTFDEVRESCSDDWF